jgi:hypothetical protein
MVRIYIGNLIKCYEKYKKVKKGRGRGGKKPKQTIIEIV